MTVDDLRRLIQKSKAIYIRPFLGVIDTSMRISKKEALNLFVPYPGDMPLINLEIEKHQVFFDEGDQWLFLG